MPLSVADVATLARMLDDPDGRPSDTPQAPTWLPAARGPGTRPGGVQELLLGHRPGRNGTVIGFVQLGCIDFYTGAKVALLIDRSTGGNIAALGQRGRCGSRHRGSALGIRGPSPVLGASHRRVGHCPPPGQDDLAGEPGQHGLDQDVAQDPAGYSCGPSVHSAALLLGGSPTDCVLRSGRRSAGPGWPLFPARARPGDDHAELPLRQDVLHPLVRVRPDACGCPGHGTRIGRYACGQSGMLVPGLISAYWDSASSQPTHHA